jgi:hypothetical protein
MMLGRLLACFPCMLAYCKGVQALCGEVVLSDTFDTYLVSFTHRKAACMLYSRCTIVPLSVMTRVKSLMSQADQQAYFICRASGKHGRIRQRLRGFQRHQSVQTSCQGLSCRQVCLEAKVLTELQSDMALCEFVTRAVRVAVCMCGVPATHWLQAHVQLQLCHQSVGYCRQTGKCTRLHAQACQATYPLFPFISPEKLTAKNHEPHADSSMLASFKHQLSLRHLHRIAPPCK